MHIALTFDVEKWVVPTEYGIQTETVKPSLQGLKRILDLLEGRRDRATFFVTGDIASRAAKLLRQARRGGHEIACHGYAHLKYRNVRPFHMKKDIEGGDKKLRSLGFKPKGFRAPGCHIREELPAILEGLGYRYDSSLHPTFIPGRYNNLFSKNRPHYRGGILELPMSVYPLARLPFSWLFARNLGWYWLRGGVSSCIAAGQTPVVYFHPWELAELKHFPEIPAYFYRNTGKGTVELVDRLLSEFRSVTMSELASAAEKRLKAR